MCLCCEGKKCSPALRYSNPPGNEGKGCSHRPVGAAALIWQVRLEHKWKSSFYYNTEGFVYSLTGTLYSSIMIGIDADLLFFHGVSELAIVERPQLVVRLKLWPPPQSAVNYMRQAFALLLDTAKLRVWSNSVKMCVLATQTIQRIVLQLLYIF